jgi:hypothetical protein
MAGMRGFDYQKYREQQEENARRRQIIRDANPWLVLSIRIVMLPITLPIRIYRWVYYG